jgi:hypothetical protein
LLRQRLLAPPKHWKVQAREQRLWVIRC